MQSRTTGSGIRTAVLRASVDTSKREACGGESFEKRAAKTTSGSLAFFLGDPSGDPRYDQGTYANVVWVGDQDPQTLIVGGLDLWLSRDSGDTLRPISTWWDPNSISAHADQHAIVAVPHYEKNHGSIFFANDGGIYEVPDISKVGNESEPPYSKGWTNHNDTYKVTQFYSGTISSKMGTIVGGSQDNGTLRLDSQSHRWSRALKDGGGDGGQVGVNGSATFFGEYAYLNLHRSVDGGTTFFYISGQYWNPCFKNPDNSLGAYDWKKKPFAIPDAESDQDSLFIAPFVIDPTDGNTIYAGGRSLWLTNNANAKNVPASYADSCSQAALKDLAALSGPSWKQIRTPVGSAYEDKISAIALSSEKEPTIWLGYLNGDIYKSVAGVAQRPSWSAALNNNVPGWPKRYCLTIKVDPNDPQTVYATFGGYESDNVWKTTNGGETWQSLGKSLPKAPIRSVAIHPRHSLFVYLGTEFGLFASEDGGLTWSPTNEGPTNASVEQLFWKDDILIAATHGRGMWQITLSK